jgi:hypothetical protein
MLTASELVPSFETGDFPMVGRRAWPSIGMGYAFGMSLAARYSDAVVADGTLEAEPGIRHRPDLTPLAPLSAPRQPGDRDVPWRRGGIVFRGMGGSFAAPHPPEVSSPSPGPLSYPGEAEFLPGEGDRGGGGVRTIPVGGAAPRRQGVRLETDPGSARISRKRRRPGGNEP